MKLSLILLFAVSIVASSYAQEVLTSSNLPIVIIKTNGQTIVDEPKIMADMRIIYNGAGNRNYLADSLSHYTGKIGIEIRGVSSQILPQDKKSYGFETWKADSSNLNVSLLGFPAEHDWIFFGPFDDETFMRDALTHKLFRTMGHYSSRTAFVELFISPHDSLEYNNYRGIYLLMEKIKRDKNRVDISELEYKDSTGNALTGGYILKLDHHAGNPGPYWKSQYADECGNLKTDFEIHSPANNDIHPAHVSYIAHFMNTFEAALHGADFRDPENGYRKYMDVASFIDYFLISELVRSLDAYSYSTYMYKNRDSKGGKLVMGPVWDYNSSMGNIPYNYCDATDTIGWQYQSQRLCREDRKQAFWWKRLLDDPAYVTQLTQRWQTLRAETLRFDTILGIIEAFEAELTEAQPRDYARWNRVGERPSFATDMVYLKDWLSNRLKWMDRNVPLLGNYIHQLNTVVPGTNEQIIMLSSYTGKQLAFQWSLDGVPLSGASSSDFRPTLPGAYSVEVTLAQDCYSETLTAFLPGRTLVSLQNGDWHEPSTWTIGDVPTGLDEVVVATGHAIVIPEGTVAKALKVHLETNAQISQELNATLMLGN